MARQRILIVEDDVRLAGILERELSSGYETRVVHRGRDALAEAAETPFDLVLLDLNLPDVDGIDVAEALDGSGVEVVMLTARSDVPSRVRGLYAGAADYIAKPFDMDELLARVFARLRSHTGTHELRRGNLRVVPRDTRCYVDDEPVDLTPQEHAALTLMMSNQGRVYSRATLAESLQPTGSIGENAVEVMISRLRKKLIDAGAGRVVDTVRGSGYVVRKTSR